jgi:nucleoside-triphosphatase
LISGLPRSGKSTLIKKLLQFHEIRKYAGGFLTEEIRQKGERTGFNLVTIPEAKTGLLAQKGLPSPHRIGRYGINIKILEELGCSAMLEAKNRGKIIIVDEIGKMELFSKKFRAALMDILTSPERIIATIMASPNIFSDRIKSRPDAELFFLERKNFDGIYEEVLSWLDKQWDFFL